MNKTHKEIMNCLYDIISENPKFQEQSKKTLRKFISKKNIELDVTEGRKATIKLGSKFILTLN